MNNKNTYHVEPIFPVGIYIVEIPEDLEKVFNIKEDENKFLDIDEHIRKTNGIVAENTYILNKKKYFKLKNLIPGVFSLCLP